MRKLLKLLISTGLDNSTHHTQLHSCRTLSTTTTYQLPASARSDRCCLERQQGALSTRQAELMMVVLMASAGAVHLSGAGAGPNTLGLCLRTTGRRVLGSKGASLVRV